MPPQITRLVLLTAAIILVYLTARHLLTPVSYGEYGHYRGEALGEIASRDPVFAGKKACDECHSDEIQRVAKHEHKTISCETCHGVSRQHADNPDIKPTKMAGTHCVRCHESNPSRPTWLRQVVVKDHYSGKCTECHLPHQPNEVP